MLFRVTLLSTLGLAACHEEQSSLLQTVSRDHALAKRAHNVVEIEDEDVLDEAMEGKKCTNWLSDEAVAKAHDELEHFRQEMKALGVDSNPNNHVKIGAYCPMVLADTALTFAGTPCEDRNQVMEECIKGLSETCKFEKKAIKKMLETVKKTIKEHWETAKRTMNALPQQFRVPLPNLNVDDALKPIKDTIEAVNCDSFKDLQVEGLSADMFNSMKQDFDTALTTLTGLQTEQIGLFTPLVTQAQDAEEDSAKQSAPAPPAPPSLTFNGHAVNPDSGLGQQMLSDLEQAQNHANTFSMSGPPAGFGTPPAGMPSPPGGWSSLTGSMPSFPGMPSGFR